MEILKIQQYAAYKSHFSFKNTHSLKMKGRKRFQENGNQKRAEVTIRISDKVAVS